MSIEIHGNWDPQFAAVRAAFEENFANWPELGASVCVTLDEERVVDLWGGFADPERSRAWQEDTIVNVYSSTKGLAAACANLLADRGKLDLDAPVADYWPEFAAASKAELPVRYLLSHRAGLPAIARRLPPDAAFDPETMCSALAEQAPWWTPGETHGYHAFTFAWLVGEVIRRVDGRSVGQFFREEFAQPLELDAHIGCGPELDERIADLQPSPPAAPGQPDLLADLMSDPQSMSARAFNNPPVTGAVNTRAWRSAEICSANGHTNARGLARLYAALGAWTRGETFRGHLLISASGMAAAREEQSAGVDAVLGLENRIATGFMLPSPMRRFSDNLLAFGHAGAGGSLGFADPENRLSFGYAMNQMHAGGAGGDPRWWGLIGSMYDAIGQPFTPPSGQGRGTSVG